MDSQHVPQILDGSLASYLSLAQRQWLATEPARRWRTVDGTLVMADISGFTPLTERLARRGKIGAEVLTDVLNHVFGRLLDVATSLGGDCLKFGGDALFLLFTGEGHAPRAATAALEMGRLVRATRNPVEGAGAVRLDMSLGVHSGRCHLFLAGHSHAELVVAGPAATQTLAMEGAAAAGQVLVSEATAHLLDPGVLGAATSGGVLLAASPRASPPLIDGVGPRPAEVDFGLGVPVALREHARAGLNDGEHRLATIAFVAFAGTDDLLAAEGPDAAWRALDELVTTAQVACARHEISFLATDVNRNGGKIILAAGMPTTIDEGEERMLHALRELVGAPSRLAVRAGVNHGRVFAVDLGAPARRAYTVMGDAVNLAARVAFRGEPGQVIATESVLARVRSPFAVVPLEPFHVKGKSAPVTAHLVGAPATAAARSGAGVMVDRVDELAQLTAALGDLGEGRGGIIEVVGEAGIGKSRLVTAAAERAGGITVLRVDGGQYARATPYGALRVPLQGWLGVVAGGPDEVAAALRTRVAGHTPDLLPWLPFLGVAFGLQLRDTAETNAVDARFRGEKLRSVVVDFLVRTLPDPLLLVVEDAQWLDGGTADILLSLLAEH